MAMDTQKPKKLQSLMGALKSLAETLGAVGKGIVKVAKYTPRFFKEDVPLFLNPKRLYEMNRAGVFGGKAEVPDVWHKRISLGAAVFPLASLVTTVVLAFAAPTALPAFAFLACYCVMPFIVIATHDILADGKQSISVTNAAGQKVTGPRLSLYQLSRAQDKIIRLTQPFNAQALSPKTAQRVEKIIALARKDCEAVTVAGNADYQFIRTCP